MEPERPVRVPRPGMVIPFYHPDQMAGVDLASREPIPDENGTQFGRHLVQQGYVVLCTEAFPFNTVQEPESDGKPFVWWCEASAVLLAENPNWTGLAKLVHDTRLALDILLAQPDIDSSRVGIMGHSLGGIMSFQTGVLEPRIQATVGNDFGMGWSFNNWDSPWYLGDQIHSPGLTLGNHHLLALHAPRPFLLIGGATDSPASWQYLNEARKIYALYGREDAVGFVHHGTGHNPTEESLRVAYRWLAEQFDLPDRAWEP